MVNQELINKIRDYKIKNGYTLYDLSRIVDIQVSTLERWFKTKRINRLYAQIVRQKLGL